MIGPDDTGGMTPIPAGEGDPGESNVEGMQFTRRLTQEQLDQCVRFLGRHLLPHEVKILDELLVVQDKVNRKLAKLGKINQAHTPGQVLEVFCDRVRRADSGKIARSIVFDMGAGSS